MKLIVGSISVGSDLSYVYMKQTETTLTRKLLHELPDLGLLCLQKHLWGKRSMEEKANRINPGNCDHVLHYDQGTN